MSSATLSSLQVCDLNLAIDGKQLLQHINLALNPGELTVILGANGAGKSTLLKCLVQVLQPDSGTIVYGERDLQQLGTTERARIMSYLPQQRPVAWPLRVKDVVALGRFAYGAGPGRLGDKDREKVEAVMQACDISEFADRSMDTLSGGEATRVHCARAFATDAAYMLADEPTSALDPKHQLGILGLIRDYANDERGAVAVVHEPELAARFADRVIWLKQGTVIADGPVQATFTSELINDVYDVQSDVRFVDGIPSVRILGER